MSFHSGSNFIGRRDSQASVGEFAFYGAIDCITDRLPMTGSEKRPVCCKGKIFEMVREVKKILTIFVKIRIFTELTI